MLLYGGLRKDIISVNIVIGTTQSIKRQNLEPESS